MKKQFRSMVRLFLALCIGVSVLAAPVVYAEEETPITVYVDGVQIIFDVNPITENDRTLVPMRYIFEALGATVTWDDATSTATAVKGEDTIQITVDNTVMLKNGVEIILDVPARLVNDRTLVPVRAVSEGMGANVDWNEELRQVVIATPGSEHPFDELTETDMETLKSKYNNLIRYGFEQFIFPQFVLTEDELLVDEIKNKTDLAKQIAWDTWNLVVMTNIIDIQVDSTDAYAIDENLPDETLVEGYMKIVEEAGLEAQDYFDVTFEDMKDGSTMMVLSFFETGNSAACKYIGVVAMEDGSVRYFTAETDLMDKENLYFCEITTEGRTTLNTMQFERADFIAAVNAVLS